MISSCRGGLAKSWGCVNRTKTFISVGKNKQPTRISLYCSWNLLKRKHSFSFNLQWSGWDIAQSDAALPALHPLGQVVCVIKVLTALEISGSRILLRDQRVPLWAHFIAFYQYLPLLTWGFLSEWAVEAWDIRGSGGSRTTGKVWER